MAGQRRHNESTFRRGSIRGGAEAERRLQQLGEDVIFAAKLALAEGVDIIIADAKSRCPVKTGKLRDSINAVDVDNGMAYELTANATNDNGIAYGQFVEFSPKINKPFLYPAIEANRDKVKEKIRQAIAEAIRYGNRAA